MTDPDEEIDVKILKRYEIIQKIGKGAYGVVWKAIDKQSQEIIALKKYLMLFKMPQMHNEHLEKLCTYKEWTMKIL